MFFLREEPQAVQERKEHEVTQSIVVDKSRSKTEIYELLVPQLTELANPHEPVVTALSNITAALKEAFEQISWVGFYIVKSETMFLGPFQGKPACTAIKLGSGVCGSAAKKEETLIVDDVDKFPGHIACDSGSRSEIVVPIFNNGSVAGVLDLDSYSYSAFDETDKHYLEKICELIVSKFNFSKLISD